MRAPAFWDRDGVLARLLSPLQAVTAAATARRVTRPGWRAPVPVICCGNATVGGTGKTPLALDLGGRLTALGRRVAFLSRGHGGRLRGVLRVDTAAHDAAVVGDEALLLAQLAPTWVGADRAAGARAALAIGCDVLVMDDGLQNPSLHKTLSLLVVNGLAGFGNGRLLPAGPLREPVATAAARCRAAVLIGPDRRGAAAKLAPLPVLRATLATRIRPGPVFAFAGIGHPEKFFAGLRAAGAEPVETRAFADHHPYRPGELRALLDRAETLGVPAVTTAKDAVRLPPDVRARVLIASAHLVWEDADAVATLLERWL